MIDVLLQKLSIPESCLIDKPVFKKLFLENADLNATDKKALKEDIDKLRWLYTLKPGTINIPKYIDDEREYLEIAVLHVELSNVVRIKRIAEFIHKSIPYPLILLFSHASDVCMSLGDKRINQADKSKWVVEDVWLIDCFNPERLDEYKARFLEDIQLAKQDYANLYAFYQGIKQCLIALLASRKTGRYQLRPDSGTNIKDRALAIRAIEKHEAEIKEIKNKLKKEKNMGKQVELNTQVKQIIDRIEAIKQTI